MNDTTTRIDAATAEVQQMLVDNFTPYAEEKVMDKRPARIRFFMLLLRQIQLCAGNMQQAVDLMSSTVDPLIVEDVVCTGLYGKFLLTTLIPTLTNFCESENLDDAEAEQSLRDLQNAALDYDYTPEASVMRGLLKMLAANGLMDEAVLMRS